MPEVWARAKLAPSGMGARAHRDYFDSSGVCFIHVFVRVLSCVRTHVQKAIFFSELKASKEVFSYTSSSVGLTRRCMPKITLERAGGYSGQAALFWHVCETEIFKPLHTHQRETVAQSSARITQEGRAIKEMAKIIQCIIFEIRYRLNIYI